jgi:hypothetical protein
MWTELDDFYAVLVTTFYVALAAIIIGNALWERWRGR